MKLRELTPEDEPFLAEMGYLAIFVPEGQERPEREIVKAPELRKYFQGFGRAGDLGYAAVDSDTGQPIGAAWLRLFSINEKGYGFMDEATPELTVAVRPAYRGQGIGSVLLERLLEAAKAQYKAISLSVWPENPAYRLYRRLGFEVVERDGPAVTMVKRL